MTVNGEKLVCGSIKGCLNCKYADCISKGRKIYAVREEQRSAATGRAGRREGVRKMRESTAHADAQNMRKVLQKLHGKAGKDTDAQGR